MLAWLVLASCVLADDIRIHNISLQGVAAHRESVLEVLRARRRASPTYRVIDVGGAMVGWSAPVIDALVDKHAEQAADAASSTRDVAVFRVRDASDAEEWDGVLEHVRRRGKFDFAISTHFLEDIAAPRVVARMLGRVAHAGFVSTPSKYAELARGCDCASCPYRGFIHHRWIFTFISGRWTAFPKIGYLENAVVFDDVAARGGDGCWGGASELSFWWRGGLELDFVNDDFLGPTAGAVRGYYAALEAEDDCDRALRGCGGARDLQSCLWRLEPFDECAVPVSIGGETRFFRAAMSSSRAHKLAGAAAFVDANGLHLGEGCEGSECLASLLVDNLEISSCARNLRAAEAAPPSRPSARHGAYESSSRLYIASAVRSGATPSPSGESEHATIAG